MRVHRLGHIEARTLEVPLSDFGLRMARNASMFITLGIAAAVEREVGLTVEGAERIRVTESLETLTQRVLIEDNWAEPTRR